MIREGKFGVEDAVWLSTITISAKVFYTSPAVLAKMVGTANWYLTLISAAAAMLGFTFIYLLLKRFPGKGIIEAYDKSLGPYIGFIFSMLLAGLMIFAAATMVREFTEVMKVYTMPLSPQGYIIGLFVVVTGVFCFLGLETIVRFSKLFAYVMVFGFLLVIVLSAQNYDVCRLMPILGRGIKPTIINGLARSSVYGEVIILAVAAGSLQGIRHLKKAGFVSLALSAFFISLALLACTLTYPYQVESELASPVYQMVALIDYGRFFQRLDPIFLFLWSVSSFVSVMAAQYTFVSIYCKMFRIQDTRPLVIPSSVILFSAAMLPKEFIDIIFGEVQLMRQWGWTIIFIPPVIALIAAKLRKKGVRANA